MGLFGISPNELPNGCTEEVDWWYKNCMPQQDTKKEDLECEVKEQGDQWYSDTEMHFKIILGLSQGMQSQKFHSEGSKLKEDDTVQQRSIAIMDISNSKGPGNEEQQVDEGYSGHVFY